jgi:hypothetical protein
LLLEAEVIFVSGQVAKLNRDCQGKLNAILLQDGREVRFTGQFEELVASIVTVGCAVRIEAEPDTEDFPEPHLRATLITNLETQQTVTLPALKHKGKPGMQLNNTPVNTASLAPDLKVKNGPDCGSLTDRDFECSISELPAQTDPVPLHPASYFRSILDEGDTKGTNAARNDSARSIGLAYDRLHRIQAILAYLHIMRHRVPGISQFLDEAKHTYEQALSRFAAGDFIGAKEFAEASESLSQVVEIVMARTLRSDNTLPSLVPPPPAHPSANREPEEVEEHLAHAESVLARIHWVLEHGTLPSEDRAQVRKIVSWGDAFYKQARRTYRDAVLEDASEFAQAAVAGANSAEHVCRKWYANHPVNR